MACIMYDNTLVVHSKRRSQQEVKCLIIRYHQHPDNRSLGKVSYHLANGAKKTKNLPVILSNCRFELQLQSSTRLSHHLPTSIH